MTSPTVPSSHKAESMAIPLPWGPKGGERMMKCFFSPSKPFFWFLQINIFVFGGFVSCFTPFSSENFASQFPCFRRDLKPKATSANRHSKGDPARFRGGKEVRGGSVGEGIWWVCLGF